MQQRKIMSYPYRQQHGWISETLNWVKDIRYKSATVWFHLQAGLEEAELTHSDGKQIRAAPGEWGRTDWEGHRRTSWAGEKVLYLAGSVDYMGVCKSKCAWALYVNCTSIFSKALQSYVPNMPRVVSDRTDRGTNTLLEGSIHSSSSKYLLTLLCAITASRATNKIVSHPSRS